MREKLSPAELAPLHPTNGELFARLHDGDRDAWVVIVERYERLVHAIPLKEGLSAERAEDVTQHVFAELIKRIDSIREPERLGSWLMVVARREVWRIRTEQRRVAATVEELQSDVQDEDFSDVYVRAVAVHNAVQALGEPCRTIIEALFFDEAEPEYGSVARSIGRPVGSIGPLRGRCLSRLRAILEDEVQQ